ncbi:hypothetical protein [Flavobacterium sp. MK4S-17]|uniref:hypothetical protein n=1 Tax=Flavobacterium sp. MK4S-17 TaxID=2543737 RepID=UPI00135AE768|nr:hypothetical protein [Flavobacterium sp. MK4S-17]
MKKVLLLLLFSVNCLAQVNNFVLKNDDVVWENVFITDQKNIPELITQHPKLKIVSSTGAVYKGRGFEIKHTCQDSPSYMTNELNFDFEIELAEGKYRVTVYNIQYTEREKVNIKHYTSERKTLKSDKETITALNCLDSYFNKLFTLATLYKNKL